MTKNYKNRLAHFVLRPGMYVGDVDNRTIMSFVAGYEVAMKGMCNFSQSLREILENKYKIRYGSRGLPEQVEKLAKKWSSTWVLTFQKIALEVLTSNGSELNKKTKEYFKWRIAGHIEKIDENGHPWFTESWAEEWLTFIFLKQKWVQELWPAGEWKTIKKIDREIRKGNVFNRNNAALPSPELLKLKREYDNTQTVSAM